MNRSVASEAVDGATCTQEILGLYRQRNRISCERCLALEFLVFVFLTNPYFLSLIGAWVYAFALPLRHTVLGAKLRTLHVQANPLCINVILQKSPVTPRKSWVVCSLALLGLAKAFQLHQLSLYLKNFCVFNK